MQLYDIAYEDKLKEAFEFATANGFIMQEISRDKNNKRRFQIQEIPKPTEEVLISQEINELKDWFSSIYTYQEQKYRRLMTLDKKDDDGLSGEKKLYELYEEAEIKRARIQELEKISKNKDSN